MKTPTFALTSTGKTAWVWVFFVGIAALYLYEGPAQPAWGDGIGFLYSSEAGFDLDTNASSHLLFRNLCYIVASILSFLPNTTVLVGISIISALVVLLLAYRTARLFTGWQGAIAGTIMLAVAFTFWRHAVTIEVYAFNLVFVTLILFLAIRGIQDSSSEKTMLLAMLWAISLLVHIQNILLGPLALYYLWRTKPEKKQLLVSVVAFCLIASPLGVIPLVHSAYSVGEVFLGNHPAGAPTPTIKAFASATALSITYVLYNFHLWLVPIVAGGTFLWKVHRNAAVAFLTVACAYWSFAIAFLVSDSYVFYLGAYVCLVPLAAVGFERITSRLSRTLGIVILVAALCANPMIYTATWLIGLETEVGQRIESEKEYKGGLRFYLYPGMHGSPNPLDSAREWAAMPNPPMPDWAITQMVQFLDMEEASRKAP